MVAGSRRQAGDSSDRSGLRWHPRASADAHEVRGLRSVLKSDDFVADVERQFEWYARGPDGDLAEHYPAAVETTCRLPGQHPRLGDWRFFAVFRPFEQHVLSDEVIADDVLMRRAMHGKRDLPRRLLEPPGNS